MNTRLAVVGLWLVCAALVAAPVSAQVYTGRIDVTIKDEDLRVDTLRAGG